MALENVHPARKDALSKLHIPLLRCNDALRHCLVCLTKGLNQVQRGLGDSVLCHALAPFLWVFSLLQDIGARRWSDRWMGCTAHRWRCHLFARARLEPLEPVGPPTAIVVFSALKPLVCTLHGLIVHPVTSPFARGIDNTGNMPTPAQGKTRFSPDKPGDAPCRLPGYDMILLCAHSVDVLLNLAKVNRHSFQDNFIGL